MNEKLDHLAANAKAGSAKAVTDLVVALQPELFRIALRIFWHPLDAEEATQEALVRIVTRLNQFEGRSSFKTWSYRVAVNHFLSVVRSLPKDPAMSFEEFESALESPEQGASNSRPDEALLVEEAKIGCSQALLQCLDRKSRLAYVLGEILGVASSEGAYILETTEENFRQLHSRSARAIEGFLNKNCGVVNRSANCRCNKQLGKNIQLNRINPEKLLFADRLDSEVYIREIEEVLTHVELFRKADRIHPQRNFAEHIQRLLK